MVRSFLFGLLWEFAQLVLLPYVRSGFFARTKDLVVFALESDVSGEDKRRRVQSWLRNEYGEVAEIVQNLAIELAVARFVLPDKSNE